ncbi:MAG: tetratricopeptide repeat protein, partial [Myxococcota bacterium]
MVECVRIFWSGILLGLVLVACDSVESDSLDEIRQMQAAGQIEAPIPVLQALIESGDRRGEVFFRYGKALIATGQYGRAVWPLDAAAEDPEWVVPAARELARIAFSTGNFELALQTLARLRDLRTDGLEDEDFGAMLLEARAYIGTRRHYEEAIEILDMVMDFDQVRDEALRFKAAALLGLDRIDEAYDIIRAMEQVSGEEGDDLDVGPKRDESYWCSIKLSFHRESDEIEKAEELVEDCLERFPTSVGIIDEAMKVYSRQGKTEAALGVLRNAYENSPGDRSLLFPLVLQLREMGRMAEAEAILRTAVEAHSESEEPDLAGLAGAWVDLGGLLADQDKLDEALDAYAEAALLLGDTIAPQILFSQAELMIRAGRYEDALKIAETTPVEVHRPMLRGRLAFEQGDLGQTLAELNRAALLWPDNAPVRYYLARAS